MTWPLYFARNLRLGGAGSGVGLCLLWTPQEHVLPELALDSFALAGNLYSRDGVSFLVRNLLAQPTLGALLLCGKDLTGAGAALVALWEHGLDGQGRIVGDGARLHPEIAHDAVELLRRSVLLHDARGTTRPAEVAALLRELARPPQPFAPAPLIFPYSEPAVAALPAAPSGLLLRAPSVRAAYLKLIWHVLTFGQRSATQHSSDQRELLDVLTIVEDEPGNPARFSHADWMPFSRASLGERRPDGGFSGYLGQFLQPDAAPGVSYTYGGRMRAFAGAIDQLAAIVAELRASGESRRAVAALWNPHEDIGSSNPPCLDLVQARLRDGRLYLTAYFRSHDIFRAWAANAYGLRAMQAQIAAGLGGAPLGELAILSHSAHIYAHDWERAAELAAHHYRPADPRLLRDARGAFVIAVEPPELVVRHYSPAGEHLQSWRGARAAELALQLTPFVGEISHAIYLGRELQKAETALALGRPELYRQDRPLEL